MGSPSLSDLDERTLASVRAYDEHAREYQESLRRQRPIADIRRFGDLAGRGAVVLDVGCGPANDLRALRDTGIHPIGVDLSMGALEEARMLLPHDGLVRAPFDRLPFRPGAFGGVWISGAFNHLPRDAWPGTLAAVLRLLGRGPVYFACVRGERDLEPVEDDVLGTIYRSDATKDEVEELLAAQGVKDLQVELRPDPLLDRKRPWVVALGRRL